MLRQNVKYAAVKVPEITAVFWLIKILTTAMGEACSDFLANTNLILLVLVGFFGLGAAIWWQLRTDRYVARVYWTAVSLVAVTGTIAADSVHIVGVPYLISTPFYAIVLAVIFWKWHQSEGTLSIHSINTRRRELFYWAAVLATFALGTAAGDLTAATFHMGFFNSALLFAAMIMVPIAAWRAGYNTIACFWGAYVLTRPLGASVADWVGKPHYLTGLGQGDGTVTGVLLVAIIALVTIVSRSGFDVQRPDDDAAPERDAVDSVVA